MADPGSSIPRSIDEYYSATGTGTFADPWIPNINVTGVIGGNVVVDFTDMLAKQDTIIAEVDAFGYETVAASQTAQVLGGAGATGDVLERIIIVPATTTPGLVTILDGATSIPIFVGGTAELKPIVVDIRAKAVTAWKVTTGANVSVIAVGNFT